MCIRYTGIPDEQAAALSADTGTTLKRSWKAGATKPRDVFLFVKWVPFTSPRSTRNEYSTAEHLFEVLKCDRTVTCEDIESIAFEEVVHAVKSRLD